MPLGALAFAGSRSFRPGRSKLLKYNLDRQGKTTLIYADYSPSEREREWVELGFKKRVRCPDPMALEPG